MSGPQFEPFPDIPGKQRQVMSPTMPKQRAANMQMDTPVAAPIAPEPETIPVVVPGAPLPSSDFEGALLDLPSGYAFYDFKDLYNKPFRGYQLAKLSRAAEERSLLYLTEVVSSVLTNSRGDKNLSFKLTLQDLYFCLYWLRQNSYTKSQYIHRYTCQDKEHHRRVSLPPQDEKYLAPETLRGSEIIRKTSLTINSLEKIPNPEAEFFKLDCGYKLGPALMQDTLDLTEDPEFINPEFQYLGQIACYIKEPVSLRQRVEYVKEMSADDIQSVQRYQRAVDDYGVIDSVKVTCRGCGASWEEKISLDAHSFLSASEDE